MLLAFGIILFVFSIFLLAIGIIRSLWGRVNENILFLSASFLGVFISIYLMYEGSHDGLDSVLIGLILLGSGGILIPIGIWQTLWGPVAERNVRVGTMLIVYGVVILIIAILIMSYTGNSINLSNFSIPQSNYALPPFSDVKIGAVTFDLFALILLLSANALSIIKGLSFGRILRVNILSVLLLSILYLFVVYAGPYHI